MKGKQKLIIRNSRKKFPEFAGKIYMNYCLREICCLLAGKPVNKEMYNGILRHLINAIRI